MKRLSVSESTVYPLLKREGLVNTQASEQLLGDGFVTDFGIPFALVVAPADVYRYGDLSLSRVSQAGVIGSHLHI